MLRKSEEWSRPATDMLLSSTKYIFRCLSRLYRGDPRVTLDYRYRLRRGAALLRLGQELGRTEARSDLAHGYVIVDGHFILDKVLV